MKYILERMDEKIRRNDYVGYLKTSHEMHEVFLRKCGNERVFKLHRILKNNILATHIFAFSYPEHIADSIVEHRRIVEALQKKIPNRPKSSLNFTSHPVFKAQKNF